MNVGDRFTFSTGEGCEVDITIEELRQEDDRLVIERATIHKVTFAPGVLSVGAFPPGWHAER